MQELVPRFDMHDPTGAAVLGPANETGGAFRRAGTRPGPAAAAGARG